MFSVCVFTFCVCVFVHEHVKIEQKNEFEPANACSFCAPNQSTDSLCVFFFPSVQHLMSAAKKTIRDGKNDIDKVTDALKCHCYHGALLVVPGSKWQGIRVAYERWAICHRCRPNEAAEEEKVDLSIQQLDQRKAKAKPVVSAAVSLPAAASNPVNRVLHEGLRCETCGRSLGNDVGNFCTKACRATAYS